MKRTARDKNKHQNSATSAAAVRAVAEITHSAVRCRSIYLNVSNTVPQTRFLLHFARICIDKAVRRADRLRRRRQRRTRSRAVWRGCLCLAALDLAVGI